MRSRKGRFRSIAKPSLGLKNQLRHASIFAAEDNTPRPGDQFNSIWGEVKTPPNSYRNRRQLQTPDRFEPKNECSRGVSASVADKASGILPLRYEELAAYSRFRPYYPISPSTRINANRLCSFNDDSIASEAGKGQYFDSFGT
jgi:hypothetical protein